MRSRFIALAALAALFFFPALAAAAPVWAPSQGGTVGHNVACTNQNGDAIRCIQPSVTLNDATGAATGTSGNPIFTSPASGATGDVNVKQVNGATVNVGAGAAGTGTQRVTTSTDSTIGTVTAVTAITNALPAGTAILGKVGIDQTTPGTTNGVQINAALPAGSNAIGHVIADTGSTTAATQATASNLNAQVVGTVAAGAADSGNPVKAGGKYSASIPNLADGNRGDLLLDSNSSLRVHMVGVQSAGSDGISNSNLQWTSAGSSNNNGGPLGVADFQYNGTSWDRRVGNVDTAALLTLSAQAAGTVNGTDQTNYNGRGVNVVVDITAATAMTLTVSIQNKDAASGKYVTVLSTTALAGTGTTAIQMFPGAAVTANVSANAQLSRTWRVIAVVTGTSVTATVGASVIV